MKRTAMSKEELRRVEVMARVRAGGLKLADAAAMLAICYRQAKRLWRQYRKQGPDGLKHGNAGRRSNRSKWKKFRPRVLQLVRQKYSHGGDSVRAHTGGAVSAGRRWLKTGFRDVAAMDAERRSMEPGTEAQAVPATPESPRASWRVGANGWKFSRLAGGTRAVAALDRAVRSAKKY